MFLELIAVFAAGFAGAGVALLASHLSRGRLPRWLIPAAAGGAMIAVAISNEYGWYGRTAGALPEGVAVAHTVQTRAAWRPWTYVVPMTERFIAVDMGKLEENAQTEGLYRAQVYFFGRWKPVRGVELLVDCTARRRADPGLGDGSAPVWRDTGPDDPIVTQVCGAG